MRSTGDVITRVLNGCEDIKLKTFPVYCILFLS